MEHAIYCVCVRVAKKRARELRAEPGVESVLVDPVCGQLLVRFDPALTSERVLRQRVHPRVVHNDASARRAVASAVANAAAAERRAAKPASTERAPPATAWPYLARFQELLFALVAK